MNGTLGRDRVWNEHIWGELDKAVREEVGRIRVAQKVFPSTVVNNVLPVAANRVVPFRAGAPAADYDQFQPFFEISSEFGLSQAQVDGDENVHLAPSRARLAASAIANAEDRILFLGEGGIPAGVNVTNRQPGGIPVEFAGIPPGFVAEAANYGATPVPPAPRGAPPGALGNIIAAVESGIVDLIGRDQPGPYALFLSPNRYAQSFAPSTGQLMAPGDQINHVVTGGLYMVNSLAARTLGALAPPPPNTDIGILVSLGGEPTRIVLGTDATTAFAFLDARGNYRFRVFERIQMVVQDGRAFQTLAF
jgi:uncharacterized linocin/CFP29 family protein